MIWLSTSAFVLALVAVASVVVVSIISWLRTRELEHWRSTTESSLRTLSASIAEQLTRSSEQLRVLQAQTPTKLAADLAGVEAAVAKLAAQHAKLAGFVHATKYREQHAEPQHTMNGIDDPELAALLSLQGSPPVKP